MRDRSIIAKSKVLEFSRTKAKDSKDFGTMEIGKDKGLLSSKICSQLKASGKTT